MTDSIFQALAAAARNGESVALGIITGAKGSSPQKIGAKALFYPDRKIKGTLGGGCLEAEAQRLALNSIKTGKPETFELVLDHDFGWDDGLICGGKVLGVVLPNAEKLGEKFWSELAKRDDAKTWGVKKDFTIALFEPMRPLTPSLSPAGGEGGRRMGEGDAGQSHDVENWLYQEAITPPCALWIAGSGHVAQAVAPLALQLDFAVSVFDDRPELANHEFFPKVVAIHTGNWGDILTVPMPNTPTLGLIVTRGHNHDALVLESWIRRPFGFLGMIGSKRKWRMISDKFLNAKIATAEELERVACPVGIKIESKSVPEIAVSIVAQFIDKRAGFLSRLESTESSPSPR